MPSELDFYRQRRRDGGIRTGIDLGADRGWHHFQPGNEDDFDPVLVWFIDVRCRGEGLPRDVDGARRWLLEQAPAVKAGLRQLAERLTIGFDSADVRPVEQPVTDLPPETHAVIACAVADREAARGFAAVLNETADRWEEFVGQLEPEMEVA